MNRPGVSVVICCYNSAARLPETLRHLSVQVAACEWEVIVVDNASTDDTAEVAAHLWRTLGSNVVPMQIVEEPRPGLNNARQKGLAASKYDIVILCDDDNYLADDYVQRSFEIMRSHPSVGLAGGAIKPMYESPPPSWFRPYENMIAVGQVAQKEGDVTTQPGVLFGAGLVIRKDAYESLLRANFVPVLTDRKKNTLMSGGDNELCFAFRIAGWKLYYSPSLRLTHYIPTVRVSWTYIKRLRYYMGRSSIYFMAYYEHLLRDSQAGGIRKRWWWQALSTFKELLKHTPAAAWMATRGVPGNKAELQWQFLRGRLVETMAINTALDKKYQLVNRFVQSIRQEKKEAAETDRA
jgi:glycosyltransferase involved in cell wall biosynthesis